jgi:tRNA threonylcarbamoyladenosine biosynthesis protein TsaE
MKNVYLTSSAEETEAVGKELAEVLTRIAPHGALIAMEGEMGVGKTAFVRGFAAALGIKGAKSPTYTIVNEYAGTHAVFHFDMYRIEDEEDLYAIGFEDYLAREGYLFIEWSENVKDALPSPHVTLSITRTDGGCGRRIEICGLDAIVR